MQSCRFAVTQTGGLPLPVLPESCIKNAHPDRCAILLYLLRLVPVISDPSDV